MGAPDFTGRPASRCGWRPRPSPAACAPWRSARSMRAGMPWTEVFVGGGVATIGAAISAGLAVAALARRVAPPDTVDLGPRLGLPPLPSREVILHSRLSDARARRALRTLGAAFAATGLTLDFKFEFLTLVGSVRARRSFAYGYDEHGQQHSCDAGGEHPDSGRDLDPESPMRMRRNSRSRRCSGGTSASTANLGRRRRRQPQYYRLKSNAAAGFRAAVISLMASSLAHSAGPAMVAISQPGHRPAPRSASPAPGRCF